MNKTEIINSILSFTTEFDRKFLETKDINELKDYSDRLAIEDELNQFNDDLTQLYNQRKEINKQIILKESTIKELKSKYNL